MQAGQKDQPVFFEYKVETNDGGVVRTVWLDASGESPAQPDWAYILSERGSEAFESARTNARETIRLCVLYRPDVETTWRMKWLDQYYDVIHADRSQHRKNELWITARLVGAI